MYLYKNIIYLHTILKGTYITKYNKIKYIINNYYIINNIHYYNLKNVYN